MHILIKFFITALYLLISMLKRGKNIKPEKLYSSTYTKIKRDKWPVPILNFVKIHYR